jgi:riboflavin-specific deaminase-like protein
MRARCALPACSAAPAALQAHAASALTVPHAHDAATKAACVKVPADGFLNREAMRGAMSRPRVIMNCACTLDGKLAAPDGASMPLSDDVDWRRVHHLRASVDAILVGVGTILSDDPSLKVKEELAPVPPNRKLLRVVLDTHGRTPAKARVADGTAPSLILTGPDVPMKWPKAQQQSVELDGGRIDIGKALEALGRRGVRDVLVEGGGQVLRAFLQTPFVEQWTIYMAPVLVGGQGPSIFDGKPSMIGRRLHVENVESQGKGVLWTLRP